jgi:8-oxo-dGTP diphosphatase
MSDPVVSQRCAAAIVFDPQRRLLMVRRRNAPSAGLWSIPGGRCLDGEPTRECCIREVAEETSMVVVPTRLVGRIRLPGIAPISYDVDDFVCLLIGGVLRAGDDASDARWVDRAELDRLPTTPGLVQTLGGWGCLPE